MKDPQWLQHHLPTTTVALFGSLLCPLLMASTLISYLSPGNAWENWLARVTAVCSSQLALGSRSVGRYLMRKLSCRLDSAGFQEIVTIWLFSVTVTFTTGNGSGETSTNVSVHTTVNNFSCAGFKVIVLIHSFSVTIIFTIWNGSVETETNVCVTLKWTISLRPASKRLF